MKTITTNTWRNLTIGTTALAVAAFGSLSDQASSLPLSPVAQQQGSTSSYIVQADSSAAAASAVLAAGGESVRKLEIIHAVQAELDVADAARLIDQGFVVSSNSQVTTAKASWKTVCPQVETLNASLSEQDTLVASNETTSTDSATRSWDPQDNAFATLLTGADELHAQGLDGRGVTVAVVDSGIWDYGSMVTADDHSKQLIATYDALDENNPTRSKMTDDSGHGTHVTSIISTSYKHDGFYRGIAPSSKLVVARAFDAQGRGTYADVIEAIDWIVANRERYEVRVLNLSLSAPVQSHYWQGPLNQAVISAAT